jgi:formamidopyrimidine-DNA glycosylase
VPELVEVELYRRVAERALHRTIAGIHAPDAWYLKKGLVAESMDVLVGLHFAATERRGKLLVLPTQAADGREGPTVGLRFGMSGRLVVDGVAGVEDLQYAPKTAPAARYVRFQARFQDGGALAVDDPRRLGGVELDPALSALGPDAAGLNADQLRLVLGASRAPLKTRLMDQSKIAGVGNLIADEVLWQAGLSPLRVAGSLDASEVVSLARQVREVVRRLGQRGGSHMGDLGDQRRPGGRCPLDGSALARATVGGRTTWWCPQHQH